MELTMDGGFFRGSKWKLSILLGRRINSVPQKYVYGRDPKSECVQRYGHILGGSSSINAIMWVNVNHLDYDDFWSHEKVLEVFKEVQNKKCLNDAYHCYGGPVETTHVNRLPGLDDLTKRLLDSTRGMWTPCTLKGRVLELLSARSRTSSLKVRVRQLCPFINATCPDFQCHSRQGIWSF